MTSSSLHSVGAGRRDQARRATLPVGAVLAAVMALALTGCAAPAAQPERMVGVLGSPGQARPVPASKEAVAPAVAPDPAAVAAATAREATTAEAQAGLRQAEEAYARGDWITAARGFKSLTAVYPRNPQVWFGMGAASALSGNLDDASSAFETALRIDPRDARAAYNLSLIRLSQAEIALGAATSNSAQAPADVQVEIARMSKELAPVFRRSADSAPAAAAAPAAYRMQDPARGSGAVQGGGANMGVFSATPMIPSGNSSR